ncbi:hypothetical protein EST38_g6722 [Candolleomyces aberdarensis]|uniref:Uncharacterized protein n=1 Tax=Candolleomyces aberdarensis TaxID=2316362 RepID=A0A4Q2DIZ3_9AGAR|nr:hypothetical protein EST38_g6722 [Candolleomyces aberdarensis]
MSREQGADINIAEAERLKAEGNDLYSRGQYDAAKQKFTEAIEKRPDNAILYANRAAVYLAKYEYLDATWDCRKAVKLDPTYARAWGRLAATCHSLQAWPECIDAWEKGLECLSKLDTLTPVQETMKKSFEAGLKKSKAERCKVETSGFALSEDAVKSGRLPWDVAKAKYEQTIAESPPESKPSCIYLIHYAREVFEYISNAVLADKRVFGMRLADFEEKIQKQSTLENGFCRGWAASGGPATIKKEAPERLEAEGWGAVRPALAVTIRIWIFTAWLRSQFAGHFDFAHEMLMNALDVLEWGRNQWPDVSKDDRGTIFEKNFIRGVKLMLLEAMHESIFRNGPTKFTFEELIKYAEAIVDDADSDPYLPNMFFGHRLAYWMYPKGIALSILGWAYLMEATHSSPEGAQRTSTLRKASQYYLLAAKNFPEDEEYHVRFLVKALECLCATGTIPLRQTLPLCDAIRKAFNQAIEIWGAMPVGERMKRDCNQVKTFEDEHRKLISEGRCTLDSASGRLPAVRE